jgi:hypothetical protein
MTLTKDKVTFSRKNWEELRPDDYTRELIELIEDREAFIKAKKETKYFIDYEEC